VTARSRHEPRLACALAVLFVHELERDGSADRLCELGLAFFGEALAEQLETIDTVDAYADAIECAKQFAQEAYLRAFPRASSHTYARAANLHEAGTPPHP
jgi:hypothetical protein